MIARPGRPAVCRLAPVGTSCDVGKRFSLLAVLLVLVGGSLAFGGGGGGDFTWQLTPTGSTAQLRGLSVVNEKVVWTSGSLGTVLRTFDSGETWRQVSPPDSSALQFRDIEALDATHVVILAIGPGDASRVYVTASAGRSWQLTFVNDDPNAFYDCMTFFDRKRGLALSDPVDGKFRIISTSDGGLTWEVVDADMPPALPGEFAFAASGQCLVAADRHRALFATGGGAEARVFRTADRGQTWEVSSTPMIVGPAAGIFALAFRDPQHGLAVGGDFLAPDQSPNAFALSDDGGIVWELVAHAPDEYRSGAAWKNDRVAIAVGPTGSDVSVDQGQSWERFDSGTFDTVDCTGSRHRSTCWASGAQGRVAYLVKAD